LPGPPKIISGTRNLVARIALSPQAGNLGHAKKPRLAHLDASR
jgi:hypothetical protein